MHTLQRALQTAQDGGHKADGVPFSSLGTPPDEVDMPVPLPGKILAVAPILDEKGKKVGDQGFDIMMRPIQCAAKISEKRTQAPHKAGLDGGKQGEKCSCWKGPTASAALRVIQAILSYGNVKVRPPKELALTHTGDSRTLTCS